MFAPYEIKHIQLYEVRNLMPPVGNYYLVFWYNEYPLGHIWYDKSLSRADFSDAIIKAISPALNHYLKVAGQPDYSWKEHLFEEDFYSGKLSFALASMAKPKVITETITVVICTRNRPNELKKCIEQLKKCNDQDFELLVVDNASDTDETKRVVAAFGDVNYVWEDRKGLDIARNTGIRQASNAIIAYTDDDVMVDVNWITRVKEGFENPLTMALTGLTVPLEISTKAQYLFERDWGFNKGYLPKTFDNEYVSMHMNAGKAIPAWDVGAGANMAFRKDIFKVVGGFDERLDVGASGCSGDSEMWHRILAEGWSCFYMPRMVVYHQHRKTMAELNSQLYYYMKGHVSALLVQHEKYGHVGDIKRVKSNLPKWYVHRVKSFIKTLDINYIRSFVPEVKGCVAGWKYYKKHAVNRDTPLFVMPKELVDLRQVDSNTLVTVIITCYNYGHYLARAIESVKRQTHKNHQIVVVDDGSTDNTAAICSSYPEVEYVKTHRVGVSTARNSGVLYSKGSHLMFLDADDWLYPNALEVQLYFFSYYPKIAFVAGGFDRVGNDGELLINQPELIQHKDGFYRHLLTGNFIGAQSNVMYRRDLFFDFYFDTKLDGSEDYDLNLRISRHLPAFSHTQKIAAYQVHANSISANTGLMQQQVKKALAKQEPFLSTPEEHAAFREGVQNWDAYYTMTNERTT